MNVNQAETKTEAKKEQLYTENGYLSSRIQNEYRSTSSWNFYQQEFKIQPVEISVGNCPSRTTHFKFHWKDLKFYEI